MKHIIKNRYDGRIIFQAEVPEKTPINEACKFLLEKAVLEKIILDLADIRGADLRYANLRYANLSHANLRYANLSDANISGANLRYANLSGADISGANLSGANLSGANLSGANLSGADISGANLSGAKITEGLSLVGIRPFISIGPIGSGKRTVFAWITDDGLRIQTGCFFGCREKFVTALNETHGKDIHATEYEAALVLIDKHYDLWRP